MKRPLQFLIVGLPYSGKTTLAKELENKLGFARINIDELKFNEGYTDVGDDDVPDEVWKKIFKKADQLIVKYLKDGDSLANEYAWITRQWRDRARKVAKEAGFDTKLIYIKVAPDEIQRRWLENSKTKKRFHWPEKEFESYLRDFEEPTQDEDIIIFDQTIPVEELIKKNIISSSLKPPVF